MATKKKLFTIILSCITLACVLSGALFVKPAVANEVLPTVINPIAKYEFKDATDLGKDSMGNYNMVEHSVDKNGNNLKGATLIDGGGVAFSDNFCISQTEDANMFADVTAFTLCFEIMTDIESTVDSEQWEHYIGVNRIHNKSNHLSFIGRGIKGYEGQLRLFERSMLANGTSASVETSATKIDKANEKVKPTEFKKIVVSVQPGGKICLYFNGEVVPLVNENNTSNIYQGDVPEGFAYANDGKSYFSIGGRYGLDTNNTSQGLFVDRTSAGAIRNVQFYDFAMDATCVSAYNQNGKITTADTVNLPKVTGLEEIVFDGEETSENLNAGMSNQEILSLMNSANAKLTLSNGSFVTTPITWVEIEKDGDDYYAKGKISSTKLGYANIYGTEVSYKLSVPNIKDLSAPKFSGYILKSELVYNMSESEMLALINTATVTITFFDDSTQDVEVTFTEIKLENGVYTAYGKVVFNDTLYGKASVELDVTSKDEYLSREIVKTDLIMSFALFSDTHMRTSNGTTNFLASLTDAKNVCPDLSHAIVLGDLSDRGISLEDDSKTELDDYYDWLDNYEYKNSKGEQIPFYNVLGNHDVRTSQAEGFADVYQPAVNMYLDREGVETLQWDKWINGYHFIFLNTDEFHKDYCILSKETIEWLDETLAENEDGRPIFVMMHQNIGHVRTNSDAPMTFEEVIARHPSTIVSSGHTHDTFGNNEVIDEGEGIYINQPAMYKSERQYYIVEVYEGGIIYRARECSTHSWINSSDVVIKDNSYIPEVPEINPPEDTESPENPENKKGCKANILEETIIISLLALATAVIYLRRKGHFIRRKD